MQPTLRGTSRISQQVRSQLNSVDLTGRWSGTTALRLCVSDITASEQGTLAFSDKPSKTISDLTSEASLGHTTPIVSPGS